MKLGTTLYTGVGAISYLTGTFLAASGSYISAGIAGGITAAVIIFSIRDGEKEARNVKAFNEGLNLEGNVEK